ncbi:HAMP domain-containing sensor histidine kinase [uncultured Bacteroides sp.]|uniref:sensor histidine kinase n=1 Tax=uncultured Bacteroides sp. TaxID=162156 RepID=UPI002AA6C295|nr:HAMP domain-containing sensor histidine kinase [uncultured Bacteroides sp.]
MESFHRFKYIVIIIISAIFVVFLWQLYWLRGLYDSIENETIDNVMSCIEDADNEELQYRLDMISRTSTQHRTISIDKSLTGESDSTTNVIETTTRSTVNENDTTIKIHSQNKEIDIAVFNQIAKEIRLALHQSLDTTITINLNALDSLTSLNFKRKGIDAAVCYSEIINLNTNKVSYTSLHGASFSKNTQAFLYIYDTENHYAYKIYTTPLEKTILKQMSGILITTFLIILILGFAFVYFIRTVMKQRTLEEMKDDFTNNMTHELKTPIAVAYSAADTLLHFKQGDNKEKRNNYLQICIDELFNLSELVEQILSMSMERRKSLILCKEEIIIRDMIYSLIEQHKLKSDKEIIFNVDVYPENLRIKADHFHLNNIMSNLIDNAIKYSMGKAIVEINVYQKDKYSFITVKDHGIGISSEDQKYIFDKFYRVPYGNLHKVKGYGLGLFYVKTMIEKHYGTVSVKSTLDKGSVFTIKIPT